jgi:hypothetical protein
MKSWVKSEALWAKSGMKTFAAMVLGPILALQGCTKEDPQNATATATQASALMGASGSTQSAAMGPQVLGQTYQKVAVPIAWRTFTGTNLAQADDTVSTVTSPFGIPFAGGTGQTSVKITMNGAISFANSTISFTNTALPSASFTNFIAPFWDDLYPGPTTADNVYWGVLGTAPSREFVVEWRNVHHRDTRTNVPADTLNFQVVFFEDSPDILFNYKDVLVGSALYDKGAAATVGVQNTTTDANQHSFNTASLANDTALLWQWITPSQAPVVGAVTTTPTTLNEGDTLTVNSSFTDPDGATGGPWKVQVDTDYVSPNFTTKFSSQAAAQGPVTATGVVRTSGNTTLAVRVLDKGNIASNISTVALTVVDVPPSLTPLAISGPATELNPVTLTSSFADPGLDSPWKVQWDFDYDGTTFTVDQESSAAATGPISLSHAFANDGTFTVALRITDKDGVKSPIQTLAVQVADLAPSLSGVFGGTDLLEGAPIDLSAVFTDPGDHSKPWKIQWDLDYDGTTFDIDEEEQTTTAGAITLSREARDSGNLVYALRVVDNDGSRSPVQTINMNIAEANPVLSPLNATTVAGGGNEPSTVSFDLAASSGAEKEAADPIRGFLWDFDGDGTFDYASATPFALYTYRDNKAGGGAYMARVRVVDEDTYSEEEIAVDIQNVAPTLSAPATADVLEGNLMALRVSAVDPGNDVLTYSISGAPAGLSLTQDGLLLWTPSFQQTSLSGKPYSITVTVTDDDGATASKAITLSAKSRDFDNDGMADTWEVAHGLNPTVNDAAGDLNGDGVSNLTQFLSENGGPRTPTAAVASGPLSGAKVNAAQIVLTTQNVADKGDLTNVQYQFQLFSDAALTTLVRDVKVDQAATAATSATLTDGTESPTLVDLIDDQSYSWRVRATGMIGPDEMHGPWSDAQRFTYNPTNDAPGAPRSAQPLSGTQVSTDKPVLVVDNAMDVDDTDLTYTFELAENAAFTTGLTTSTAIPGGAKGNTAWTVGATLKPFATYYWRVTATDPHGATAKSEVSSFTVYIGRPANREPGVPALTAISTVASLTPELVADAAVDADGDALTYVIELDSSATFTSPARQASASLQAGQDGKVRWHPAALTENGHYYWRARALDPYAASDWMVGSFTVNAQNDAPLAPVALNPSDSIIYNRKPTLLVQNSADPEGDAITYTFEVRNTDGSVVASGDVAAGANGHTSFTVTEDLDEGGEYAWVARGKDAAGAVGQASTEAKFQVYKAPEPPKDDGGCSAGAGALGGMLPLVAMALGMLRRRRQSELN